MLFELSVIYLIIKLPFVQFFTYIINVLCQIINFFSPIIKMFVISCFLLFVGIESYMNYILSSDNFISTEMEEDEDDEHNYIKLHPLNDYTVVYKSSILKNYENMGNIYLMCKDKLRPIEKLYAQNENLVEIYKSMNNYLIKMIYGIYTFIVSLQITKYVMNKIKMYFIRKTFQTMMSNKDGLLNFAQMMNQQMKNNNNINTTEIVLDDASKQLLDINEKLNNSFLQEVEQTQYIDDENNENQKEKND